MGYIEVWGNGELSTRRQSVAGRQMCEILTAGGWESSWETSQVPSHGRNKTLGCFLFIYLSFKDPFKALHI